MSASKNDHSFVVFIDESGDEGFSFPTEERPNGSSQWFVISAAIFHESTEPLHTKRIDEIKRLLNVDAKKPLHFRDLKHEKRVAYARIASQFQMLLVSVLIHKPSLYAPKFSRPHQLYWHASQLLLERVSWACRQRFNDASAAKCTGNGTARVVFSNRRTMPYDRLKNYFRELMATGGHSIDWSVIDLDQIETYPHDQRRGLQVADLVASAFFYAVEPNRFGNAEDRYVREIRTRIFKWSEKERRLGSGLKVWPSEALTFFKDACDILDY